jgi:hypothetical protein
MRRRAGHADRGKIAIAGRHPLPLRHHRVGHGSGTGRGRRARRRASVHALEHCHDVDFGRLLRGRPLAGHLPIAGAAIESPAAGSGHHAVPRQVLVEVGINVGDLAQLRLVQVLHDLELDFPIGLQRLDGFRKCADDRGRPKRIALGAHVGFAQQITNAPIQNEQLVVTEILDDPRDVASQHRFIHRQRLDQLQVGCVDLGKIGLGCGFAGDAIIDERAQLPLELRHQHRPFKLQCFAGVEEQLLLLADIGLARAIHQQIADPVENLRERGRQPGHGEIPALVQDPRDLPRRLALDWSLGRAGRGAHGNSASNL